LRGSIYKRGKTWTIVYDEGVDPVTGKRRQRSRSGFGTKKAAESALNEALSALASGMYVAPHRQSVAEFFEEWLETRRAQLRPSTWATYRRYCEVHVVPRIGSVRLVDLDPGHLQAMYADMFASGRRPVRAGRPVEVAETAISLKAEGSTWAKVADRLNERFPDEGPFTRHSAAALVRRHQEATEPAERSEGLSARTVTQTATIVKRALKDAVRWGRLVRNPADAVDAPRRQMRPELAVWDAETLSEFLTRAESEQDRHAPLWGLLASTGMRRGEALGLRWCDVDLDAGVLTVVRTLVTVGHTPTVSEPKTAAGRRPIHLDAHTVTMLRTHRRQQLEERALLGLGRPAVDGMVFTMPDGSPLHPDRVSRDFQRRCAQWGFPRLPLHGLRHTWATLAMRNGVHPRVVQERLGHSNIAVTLGTYSHVAPVMHTEAAELVAGLFRRP
jgi:integrase